jgi:regulator of RNase E activity RraA
MVLPTGGATRAAVWGELVSHACAARGVAGAVTDGAVRDVRAVRALGFPVFACSSVPADVNGRFEIEACENPVELGGVTVARGDLLVADDDGAVIVPRAVEDDVIARVVEKATGEDRFRAAVLGGMAPSAAYERYGVL